MFSCRKCKGESVPPEKLNSTQIHIGENKFEAALTFWYLGDMIGESGNDANTIRARIGEAKDDFRKEFPIIIIEEFC